jgi:hypothetical protein
MVALMLAGKMSQEVRRFTLENESGSFSTCSKALAYSLPRLKSGT